MCLAFHSWYRSILIKSFNEHLNQVVLYIVVFTCIPIERRPETSNTQVEIILPNIYFHNTDWTERNVNVCQWLKFICSAILVSFLPFYKTPINIINSTDKEFD